MQQSTYEKKMISKKNVYYLLFCATYHLYCSWQMYIIRISFYFNIILYHYTFRTSGNQNIRQDKIDGESEENAVPGDLRHGIDTSSKRYSVKLATEYSIHTHTHFTCFHNIERVILLSWLCGAIHSNIPLLSVFIFLRSIYSQHNNIYIYYDNSINDFGTLLPLPRHYLYHKANIYLVI